MIGKKMISLLQSCILMMLMGGCLSLPAEISNSLTSLQNGSNRTKVAEALYHNGDLASAARIYQELVVIQPTEEKLWGRYADILYDLKAYPEALDAYIRFTELSPSLCSGFIGAGRSSLKVGKPAYANVYFQRCHKLEENNYQALLGLAISNDLTGKYQQSSNFYQQAIVRFPANIKLRNNFALSRLLAGDFEQAIGELNQFAFGPESSVRMRQNLALAYGMIGDDDAAFQVASLDLPPDIVENNIKYYAFIRSSKDTENVLQRLIAHPEVQ